LQEKSLVGRLASNPDTVGSAKGGPIPAAQYVRMSTEHQRCSTENQSDAILQFVSVTQQFNTTSSMGRLTLNKSHSIDFIEFIFHPTRRRRPIASLDGSRVE
jgi:hypothetical protein